MADFNYTGGVRFAPDKVVDVTADKDGNPTKACNPITGVCLEGGGDSDFSTAEVTIINHTTLTLFEEIPSCFDAGEMGEGAPAICAPRNPDGYPVGETIVKVPLYKGAAVFFPTSTPNSISGDMVQTGAAIVITGDGSITWVDEQ